MDNGHLHIHSLPDHRLPAPGGAVADNLRPQACADSPVNDRSGLTVPESVTRIDEAAFQSCYDLAEITIPEGVTYIGEQAFKDCTGLRDVFLPASAAKIDRLIFNGCKGPTVHAPVGSYAERCASECGVPFRAI